MKIKRFFVVSILFIMVLVAAPACGLLNAGQVFEQQIKPETVILPEGKDQADERVSNEDGVEAYEGPMSSPMPTASLLLKEIEESAAGAPIPSTMTPPNQEPYWDNFFENYGVNPFIDTEDDHFSTFALDVDTGSYSIMRRFVEDGYLPDKDSVRVEEYINYFNQGYAYPTRSQTFSINMDGSPTPFTETDQYHMMRVGVQGYAVAPEDRKDVALTFVIDVSGSMDMENRLELVKDALELLVDQLDGNDSVSIVVYGTNAHVILEPTRGSRKEEIMHAIRSLVPEGSTNAEDGIRLGYKMALSAFNPKGINRVILCSDGVANVGNTGAENIWDQVEAWASEGITLTTVGFGMGNYNDVLMEQLANIGNGFYTYVDTLAEAKRIFVTNITSTLQVIALDAKIQVDFNPDVVSRYRLVGFENRAVADEDFRNDEVDAGEIGAGHTVTALYEIKLNSRTDGKIADVFLRWEDPDTREVYEMSRSFHSEDLAEDFNESDPHLQLDVVVAEYAEILRGSYWAQNSSLQDLAEETRRISRYLEEDPDVRQFEHLLYEASKLEMEI